MSVTITIQDNREYLEARHPDLIRREKIGCICTNGPGEVSDPDCAICKGIGLVDFDVYPFELTLANGNFGTVFSALGFSVDDSWGRCSAQELSTALRCTPMSLAHRTDYVDHQPGRCKLVAFGIDSDRAERYWIALRLIADEAAARNKDVVWF